MDAREPLVSTSGRIAPLGDRAAGRSGWFGTGKVALMWGPPATVDAETLRFNNQDGRPERPGNR